MREETYDGEARTLGRHVVPFPLCRPEKMLRRCHKCIYPKSDTVLPFGAAHGSSTYAQSYQFTVYRPCASRALQWSARFITMSGSSKARLALLDAVHVLCYNAD